MSYTVFENKIPVKHIWKTDGTGLTPTDTSTNYAHRSVHIYEHIHAQIQRE